MDNHRRRRRKKPVDRCTRQDAELDQEVDDFLNDWSSEEHPRKRPWRYTYDYFNAGDGGGCGGVKGKDSLPAQTEVNGAVAAKQRHSNIDIKKKSSLPTLLRLREIGSTRFDQFGSRRSSTSATWKSRLLHQPYIASAESTTSAHQFYSLSSSQSQWNALQFSMPTYYGNYNNISSINEGAATTSSATGKGSIVPDNDHLLRFTWRPYSQRKIPFSKLRTPISDA
jgi:hypothetical protein